MSAETEPAARRSHRDAVYDKAADAGRPVPVPLTEELCLEVAGEHPSSARVIELLFTSLEPLPALLCCEQLQELTLMHARMRRMPPELQHLRPTLRRLSLGGNEIEVIEHLDGMVRLHSLFLHENQIRSPAGLRGCTALERLWLNGNRIESLGNELGHQTALRELWLQANPLESPSGLEGLASLQVLSLAGTRVASLGQLELLRPVTALFDLAMEDGHYGAAPLVSVEGYTAHAIQLLPQLGVLDGKAIAANNRSDADEVLLRRSQRLASWVDAIKEESAAATKKHEAARQVSAASLRTHRQALGRAFAELKRGVLEGLGRAQAANPNPTPTPNPSPNPNPNPWPCPGRGARLPARTRAPSGAAARAPRAAACAVLRGGRTRGRGAARPAAAAAAGTRGAARARLGAGGSARAAAATRAALGGALVRGASRAVRPRGGLRACEGGGRRRPAEACRRSRGELAPTLATHRHRLPSALCCSGALRIRRRERSLWQQRR